jgi:hypothetical protein
MSKRVSWKCNRSERLIMIPSSYSFPSSGCSSCSAALSGSAAISRMSMGSGTGTGSGYGCGCGASLGMWDKLWRHWIGPKYGLSVIGPSIESPFIPFLPQNMNDEKRERQAPGLCVLCSPVVHSITEFLDLTPDNLKNGTPESSVE